MNTLLAAAAIGAVPAEPAEKPNVFIVLTDDQDDLLNSTSVQPKLLGPGHELEDFCMQIDAHSLFPTHWDDIALRQFCVGRWLV